MNRCNISFAISRVEDCLELNFKCVDYQTLAHLSYSSCVCLTSVLAARAQRFLSVRVLISDSICDTHRHALSAAIAVLQQSSLVAFTIVHHCSGETGRGGTSLE